MVKKGIVSNITGSLVRVTFPSDNDVVSGEIPIAAHITGLLVGSQVAVIFFYPNNFNDGVIVGRW
jgi:hypothetical protein